jgi:hypothetical protein
VNLVLHIHPTVSSKSVSEHVVEQAHSIIYILQQYSNLTLYISGEGRAGEAGCCFS